MYICMGDVNGDSLRKSIRTDWTQGHKTNKTQTTCLRRRRVYIYYWMDIYIYVDFYCHC